MSSRAPTSGILLPRRFSQSRVFWIPRQSLLSRRFEPDFCTTIDASSRVNLLRSFETDLAFAPDDEQARTSHNGGPRVDVPAGDFAKQHVAEEVRQQKRHIIERSHHGRWCVAVALGQKNMRQAPDQTDRSKRRQLSRVRRVPGER